MIQFKVAQKAKERKRFWLIVADFEITGTERSSGIEWRDGKIETSLSHLPRLDPNVYDMQGNKRALRRGKWNPFLGNCWTPFELGGIIVNSNSSVLVFALFPFPSCIFTAEKMRWEPCLRLFRHLRLTWRLGSGAEHNHSCFNFERGTFEEHRVWNSIRSGKLALFGSDKLPFMFCCGMKYYVCLRCRRYDSNKNDIHVA